MDGAVLVDVDAVVVAPAVVAVVVVVHRIVGELSLTGAAVAVAVVVVVVDTAAPERH